MQTRVFQKFKERENFGFWLSLAINHKRVKWKLGRIWVNQVYSVAAPTRAIFSIQFCCCSKMGGLKASWQKPGESMMGGWCRHRAELGPMARITLSLCHYGSLAITSSFRKHWFILMVWSAKQATTAISKPNSSFVFAWFLEEVSDNYGKTGGIL